MALDLVDVLVCPACRASPLRHEALPIEGESRRDGVYWCTQCERWYPEQDGLLELLDERLAYMDDRERFWAEHRDALTDLGLRESPPGAGIGDHDTEILHQQEHFDWYADNPRQTYSQYEHLPFWQALDAMTFERWRLRIRPGSRVLDVGCAQGRSTFKIVRDDIDVVGFDISKALIREALDRVQTGARLTFFVGDASSLPFMDESFDFALTYGVLHHLPDPAGICREIARVLRPGGTFFASENNRTIFRSAFELLQRIRPQWYEEAGAFAQISRRQLATWLEGAGLAASIRTSVFVPPHALNHVRVDIGTRVLRSTDRVAAAVPGLRDNGGLVVAEAVKEPAWQ
ncbi:MAG: methyltransferase domain-containing protein [Gaiellaceae bacterium]